MSVFVVILWKEKVALTNVNLFLHYFSMHGVSFHHYNVLFGKLKCIVELHNCGLVFIFMPVFWRKSIFEKWNIIFHNEPGKVERGSMLIKCAFSWNNIIWTNSDQSNINFPDMYQQSPYIDVLMTVAHIASPWIPLISVHCDERVSHHRHSIMTIEFTHSKSCSSGNTNVLNVLK